MARGGGVRSRILPAALLALACTVTACGADPSEPDARASYGPGLPSPALAWDTSPESIAALGDSITTGYDSCSLLADCPEASWATGTRAGVSSLADRLLPQREGNAWNYAVAGATMADLPGQAARAAAHDPELVTVLVGANDACAPQLEAMTPVDEFRADFTKALTTLREQSPDTQVYVASVPDLERLWTIGRDNVLATRVWEFGVCPTMLRDPAATDDAATERRAQVAERVDAYNTVLREACTADALCRYDGGAVHDYAFTAAEVSPYDWFHPSEQGQAALADLAHAQVTSAQRP
ncbi:SGNH/GDSL hydrolase family protein [Streptomyces sp. JJ66]|uniref:GDSL-type esterase/lipase family protein n=1 Tax=Streptomyces sp. JJ66 TaxID=2803843 RepID=UPI001C576949|nr:GDSL-type esterase/lipase family protein [Streptomyces sp. JJ66]MBW1600958.1 SGNH/GDSL hydrolase family protein [Streptomyces sp. JJ66]